MVRIPPTFPVGFIGDVGRIRQILTNIIGNAVKFTSDGHVLINIEGEIVDNIGNLTIQIVDTGIGIEEDKLKTVFDKFSQADGSTTRKYGGTGLGLSISKHLVELMDGTIEVRSNLGEGSTFSIALSLPVAAMDTSPIVEKNFNIAGSNVLIIDDNAVNLEILKEQFSHWKCKTAIVDSAKLGLSVLHRAHEKNVNIDLIIVDYQMPEMNGEDFYKAMRKQGKFSDIPVIMLSSVDATELRQRMMDSHLCDFLTKPARSSILHDAVGQAIYGKYLPSKLMEGDPAQKTVPKPSGSFKAIHPDQDSHIDVLIAEDNEVNQIYASYVMKELGLTYKIVPNGKLAVDRWRTLSPRVILMDVSMPEMNGYEATQAIRLIENNNNLARTPIIAATAHSMKGDKQMCLDKTTKWLRTL